MSTRPPVLAAIATIPSRLRYLPRVVESLRPQVDRLFVYLQGHEEVPNCVLEYADEVHCSPSNDGAEAKLHWAPDHDGLYFSCDDDILYPSDYVETMATAVERWEGRAIVTAHGRIYLPRASHFGAVLPESIGIWHRRIEVGSWINCPGTGVMAWDARRVRIPREWPERNMADLQVAVWAQRNGVPIWRIPHGTAWLNGWGIVDPAGIFKTSQREGHRRRNRAIAELATERGWKVFEA